MRTSTKTSDTSRKYLDISKRAHAALSKGDADTYRSLKAEAADDGGRLLSPDECQALEGKDGG